MLAVFLSLDDILANSSVQHLILLSLDTGVSALFVL